VLPNGPLEGYCVGSILGSGIHLSFAADPGQVQTDEAHRQRDWLRPRGRRLRREGVDDVLMDKVRVSVRNRVGPQKVVRLALC